MTEKFLKNENPINQKENLAKFDLSEKFEVQRTLHFDLWKVNNYIKSMVSEQDEMTEHFANDDYQNIFKRVDIYGEESKNGLPVHLAKEKIDQKINELNVELEKVGIAFEKIDNNDERGEELDSYISDGKKFLAYLQSIQENTITATQKESLQEFLEQLRTQIFNASHENDQRLDHFLNALPYINEIVENAKRLQLTIKDPVGLEYDISDISEAIRPIKNHYLKEFATSKRSWLYQKRMGPMWWHNNKKAPEYKEILQSVLDDIKTIRENPNASELYNTMKNDFTDTLNKLHKVIEDRPSEWEKENTNAQLLPLIEEFLEKSEKLSGSG